MAPLKGLPPEMLLYLLVELSAILGTAHLLGELMRRWKQPAVIGNILAGVLLGPSVLGHWLPKLQLAIFPHDQNQANLLAGITWVGLLLLLLSTGLETDINLIVRNGRVSLLVSAGGIIVPLISGYLLGHSLPDSVLAHPTDRLVFSLFLAVAMCISALPVIAMILRDLKMIRREVGQLALSSAMLDDTLGWILLSVVSGLALSGRFDILFVARTLGFAVLFLVASFVVGRPLVRWILTWTDNTSPGSSAQLAVLIFLGLVGSTVTHWMGLEAAMGIFVVGILVGMVPRLRSNTVHSLDLVVSSFLGPIYFGLAGLRFDIWSLFHWTTFLIVLAVMAVACFGKMFGVYAGAWMGGVPHWERLAMSFGMNARGAMEIIVATVGFSMGVLTLQMYSVIVVMAVVTALMAGPTMQWALAHVEVSGREAERMNDEAARAKSLIRRLQRVLLPAWGGSNVQQGADLAALLSKGQAVEVTALFVARNGEAGRAPTPSVGAARPSGHEYTAKTVNARDIAQAILAEAERAYDLIVMEISRGNLDGTADAVIQNAPCPTLVVQPSGSAGLALRSIVVSTDGGRASTQAVEFAAKLALSASAHLAVLCVAQPPENPDRTRFDSEDSNKIAREIASAQAEQACKLGADADAVVVEALRPESGILRVARERDCDLIVISGSVLPITGRAFLGSMVENVLRDAPCTVAVLNIQ